MLARRTVLAVLALALLVPASAPARQTAGLKAPSGLKAFALRYDEPASRNFSRTPAFSWEPVPRAGNYEFQLATSDKFRENSIVWSSDTLAMPYVSIPLALPWTTGHPYSLFARVRAHTQTGTTPWSTDFGFNVRWSRIPAKLPAPIGLLRWTPVDGASIYEITETTTPNEGSLPPAGKKSYFVGTNVTDMRDWYTFHQGSDWVGTVYWRVRAVRVTYGMSQNGQTSTSYGPWSPLFQTNAAPPTATRIDLIETISDVIGTNAKPAAHTIMPGFAWSGSLALNGTSFELYRTYIFSDRDCVDPVFTGSIVGSPAWVPRLTGALVLPRNADDLSKARAGMLADGNQGKTLDSTLHEVTPNENVGTDTTGGGGAPRRLDLWDRKWPSGAYYWTTVPVRWFFNVDQQIEYWDTETPQDACAAGRIGTFGRISNPIPTGNNSAYVTGLSLSGRTMSVSASSFPRVYGTPLVTWTPVLGADEFEVQWSRMRYPFSAIGTVTTPTASTVLSLKPGVWYYRVRGINLQMPTAVQGMAWSSVRTLRLAKPVFRVVG
ncbi:MAG: hypothetical protein ABSB96_04495 [Gaiellaceae bacterium]